MEITQDDGTVVEVFTSDELAQQKQDAIEAYKMENPDKTDELLVLQGELDKLKAKDLNFTNLRTAKEATEKKIEEITKEIDEKVALAKKEVLEGVLQDYYNDTLKNLSGEDEETKKKIEFHYKRLGDTVATKEEMGNKLRDAWVLATTPEGVDALNTSVISSGGVGRLPIKTEKKFTAEEKAMAQKLAQAGGMTLSEEDFAK